VKFLAKNDDQSIEDWIEQLDTDCMLLHLKSKDMPSLDNETRGDYFQWFLECSDEPQYKLMRELAFFIKLNTEAQLESLLKIQTFCQECRSYVKSLEQESQKDRYVRIYAEMLYKQGKTVIETVTNLIEVGLAEDETRDNTEKRIHNYRKKLPSFETKDSMNFKVDIKELQKNIDPKKFYGKE